MAEYIPGRPPPASLLDCSPAEGTGGASGLLSLGLAGGELMTVQLSLDELSRLAGDVLRVLVALGHEPAKVPAYVYTESVRRAPNPCGSAGTLLPSPQGRRAQRSRTRPRKPFSRSSGSFLKVRFKQEATHRRIAILRGWHVDLRVYRPRCKQPVRQVIRLRWRMLVDGKARFRDFFVVLPPDGRSRDVCFAGHLIEGIRISSEHLEQLAGCRRGDEVSIGELRFGCWPLSEIMKQTGRIVFQAGCTANQ